MFKTQTFVKLFPFLQRFRNALNFTFLSLFVVFLALLTYIGVNSLVTRDMRARLDMEAQDIQRAYMDRIQSYADTLLNLRAFISRMGIRDTKDFKNLMSEMKVFDYYTGVSALSIAVVYPLDEKKKYENLLGLKTHSLNAETKVDDQFKLGSAIVHTEPETHKSIRSLGFDLFSETRRKNALSRALALNTPVISAPIILLGDHFSPIKSLDRWAFNMMVPFQTDKQVLTIQNTQISGVLAASFRFQVLIDEIFGPPSLDNEHWNFVLSTEVDGETINLYDRFDTKNLPSKLSASKKFSVHGQVYQLTVSPLAAFFNSADRFLPLAASFAVLLVGSLMLLLYRSTLTQLRDEQEARARSRRTHEKLRQQTTLLSKLNRFGVSISKQFDPEIVLQKFFEFGEKEDFEFVAILKEVEDSKELVLITPDNKLETSIQLGDVNELFGAVNRIGRSDLDYSPEFLHELRLSTFSDWQMVRVRFNQRSSFLIIGLKSDSIEESDIELMKSTFSQLVVALETAVLLQKAEEGSRLKTAFLANMSHEIRTPLNAILGFTQILTKSDISDEKRLQLVSNIEKNTGLLTRLIDDILDIAKVEAGKIDIVPISTSLEGLLKDTQDVFELRTKEKKIQFSIEIKTELPRFIRTDEYRFKQILYNLISNAIKFTDRGQVIIRIYSEIQRENANLIFEVEDSGIGITKEAQEKLFFAFYQGDLSTTRRFGGSGLGLTLSKRLAREMNGDIELLSSEPHKGSIFSFHINCTYLPDHGYFKELPQSKPQPSETHADESKPLSDRNILLVEDSEDNQLIFTHFLKQAGANVVVAVDGKEALLQARQVQDLDLILMDIQIPFIDGREVTRTLRKEGLRIPILALTAHALESEKRSCREAGCNAQITKPATYSEFIGAISSQLEL